MKNKKSPGFAFGKAGAFPFERKRTGGKTAQKPGCRKKTAPGKGRFCGIAASKHLDNHQGCLRCFSFRSHQNRPLPGAAQSGSAKRPRPRRGLGPAGRSAKQSGRIFIAPAAHVPGFWMKKAQRAAPQALLAAWGGRSACFMRQNSTAEPPFSYATPAMSDYFFFMMVRFMISLTTALSTTVATVAGTYTSQKE